MDWNGFASPESSWEAEGGRWQSGQQVTDTLSLPRTGNSWALSHPSHLPFSCSGLLWYLQSGSKLHSMKKNIVLAFAHHILAAKQTSGYIRLQHQSIPNQLRCFWFRAIQLKKGWNPVCKSSGIFRERDLTKQKYCPVQISLANTDDLLHCKKCKQNLIWKHQESL